MKTLPDAVYIGIGTNEIGAPNCDPKTVHQEDNKLAIADVMRLKNDLLQLGLQPARIKTTVALCAVHHEEAWRACFSEAITFLMDKLGCEP